MTQGIRVKQQLVKGTLLTFGGVDYAVRNKRVAKAMVRDGRPVWSCRPRPGGLAIVSLVDGASSDLTDRYMIDSTATNEVAPGLYVGSVVQVMSMRYMRELEAWVRACQA